MAEELLIPKLAKAVEMEFGHILAVEANRKEQTMRYENMPKGRNKDICVRCGKRANFADRLKSDVQYDLLCLAETTSSGYMTHGNVKLCGKCMSELLMWLDADDFCSYGEREGE